MKKFVAPAIAILIGLLVLGPIGAVLAFLIWCVYSHETSTSSK